MKITKKQLKDLIREQVAAVLEGHDEYHEDDWFDILAGERGSPISFDPDGTEASMTPNEEVEAENALMAAVDALANAGYTPEEIRDLLMDVAPEQGEEAVKIGTPQQDPMDRSALGKYRRGKMTNFTEDKDDSFSDAGEEIEKKGTTGVFTKKAEKRGMTAQEFARKVLANTDEYDLKTVRQASFAKGADTVAKKRKKK
jgi:hypothetical protein